MLPSVGCGGRPQRLRISRRTSATPRSQPCWWWRPRQNEEEALVRVALRGATCRGGRGGRGARSRPTVKRVACSPRWNAARPTKFRGGRVCAHADTSAGRFARLAAEAALRGLAPVTLLGTAQAPADAGLGAGESERARGGLERAVPVGSRPRGKKAAYACARHVSGGIRKVSDAANHHNLHPSDPHVCSRVGGLGGARLYSALGRDRAALSL